jgi:peptidoglycan hydrolase-like protein with peptidoglycan-binding domain
LSDAGLHPCDAHRSYVETVSLTNCRGDRTVSFLGSVGRVSATLFRHRLGSVGRGSAALFRHRGIMATGGAVSRGSAALFRHRGITATAGAAALVLIGGGTFAAVSSPGANHESLATAGNSKPVARTVSSKAPAAHLKPLTVVSVSPGHGASDVNGAGPIKVTFSSALSAQTPLPTLSPKISGSWQVAGKTATFTPSYGYSQGTHVTVHIPGGDRGIRAAAASTGPLPKSSSASFTTGSFSMLRLQQLLAQLGYLPLNWTAGSSTDTGPAVGDGDLNGQLSAAYAPPAGSFSFQSGYPSQLTSQWQDGSNNVLVQGAVRAFESVEGLTMDGVAGPQVWSDLLQAAAKDHGNPNGYSYALASQGSSDESLQVWHDGKRILDAAANTGIAAAPTADGTFPVYERLQFQIMQGTNPDGSKYADPVSWISYFNGGDAVHGFYRGSYGYYQSLGCVELPPSTAQYIWPYLTYGTLVTVQGPVA